MENDKERKIFLIITFIWSLVLISVFLIIVKHQPEKAIIKESFEDLYYMDTLNQEELEELTAISPKEIMKQEALFDASQIK